MLVALFDFNGLTLTLCMKLFFPQLLQVLQISDILEYSGACNDRSVVILLVFLASQLIVKKNMVILELLCYFYCC